MSLLSGHKQITMLLWDCSVVQHFDNSRCNAIQKPECPYSSLELGWIFSRVFCKKNGCQAFYGEVHPNVDTLVY